MATVPRNIVLDANRIANLQHELPPPLSINKPASSGRLHLYAMGRSPSLSLDGTRIGTLGMHRYACWDLAPGPHSVRFREAELNVHVQAGAAYYVQLSDRLLGPLRQTEGYQLGTVRMTQAKRLANQIPCWHN